MPAAPILLTDAIPLMQVGGTTGQNNAKDFRRGLLATIFTSDGAGTAREGVIAQAATSADSYTGFQSLRVYPLATPGLGVRINGGACIINRTGEGPYLVWMETAITTMDSLPAAHATLQRVDSIVVRLADKNISADSAGSLHGGYFDIIQGATAATANFEGTPGTAGAPPIIPNGCLKLADVKRIAGSPGDIIDSNAILLRRKATSIHGTPKFYMEETYAESLLAGVSLGETRYIETPDVSGGPSLSLWDGAEWRGLRPNGMYTRLDHSYVTANGTIGYFDPSGTRFYRHMALVSVNVTIEFDGTLGSVAGNEVQVVLRVENETTGNRYVIGNARDWSGGAGGSRYVVVSSTFLIPEVFTPYTPRLYLRMENKVGSGIYALISNSGTDYKTYISVTQIPV